MQDNILIRSFISVGFVVLWILLNSAAKKIIHRVAQKKNISEERELSLRRFIQVLISALIIISLTITWGVKVSYIWVYLSSTFAVVGVVMFSKFSLLSNIFSAFLIYFKVSIKLGDTIAINPNEKKRVKGKIVEMTLFHIFLQDDDGNRISIYNNIILEKPITKYAEKPIKPSDFNWQTMTFYPDTKLNDTDK